MGHVFHNGASRLSNVIFARMERRNSLFPSGENPNNGKPKLKERGGRISIHRLLITKRRGILVGIVECKYSQWHAVHNSARAIQGAAD